MFKMNNFKKIIIGFSFFLFISLVLFVAIVFSGSKLSFYRKQLRSINFNKIIEVNIKVSDDRIQIVTPVEYYQYNINLIIEYDFIDGEEYTLETLVENGNISVIGVKESNGVILADSNHYINNQRLLLQRDNKIFLFIFIGLLCVLVAFIASTIVFDTFKTVEYFYIFPIGLFSASNLVIFITTVWKPINLFATNSIIVFDLELIIAVASLLNIIISTLYSLFKYNQSLNYYVSTEKDSEYDFNPNEIDKNDDYEVKTFVNVGNEDYKENYYISDKINQAIINNEDIKTCFSKIKYKVPSEIAKVMPYALKTRLKSNKKLFNDTILRLDNDLLLNDNKINNLQISRTTYFDTLGSNGITNETIKNKVHLDIKFEGKDYLLCKEKNELISLSDSNLANHIGINTLAITSDNYLIIRRQGDVSEIGSNKLVNSGSGSLNYQDYLRHIKSQKHYKYNEKLLLEHCIKHCTDEEFLKSLNKEHTKDYDAIKSLLRDNPELCKKASKYKDEAIVKKYVNLVDLLIYGAEREFLEETGIKVCKKNFEKIETKLIGYMRVLDKGAKPDFFAISKVKFTKTEIEKYIPKSKEYKNKLMGEYKLDKINDMNNIKESIVSIIDKYIATDKVTIQLNASREIIKNCDIDFSFIAK